MSGPIVLDEDTYTEAISLIIERDFFPNLAKIRAQQSYLQAQQSGSFVELQEASKKLHNTSSLSKKTRDQNQPVNFYFENEPDIEKRVNLNLSLDQFQTLYTSEDNASFTDLLEKANIKVKQQNKWFFHQETKQLRIAATPDQESPIKLIESGNSNGWKYKARNALMYFPEGKSESWINQNEGRGLPKAIEYQNTHLDSPQKDEQQQQIVTNARPMTPWSQLNGISNDSSSSTPAIRGYNLVDATPSLSPTRMGTPQMTWGSIEGTPLLISGSQTPGYHIPQISKREELGMKLSEKASRAYRKKVTDRHVQGTPRSGAGLMSPAAQHLLRKSGLTPRAQSGFGEALRNSYGVRTPHTIKRTSTPTPIFKAGATPQQFKKK